LTSARCGVGNLSLLAGFEIPKQAAALELHFGVRTFYPKLTSKGRLHMPVSSDAEKGELLERVDQVLESLERREQRRR
jgi:hypothetical protein